MFRGSVNFTKFNLEKQVPTQLVLQSHWPIGTREATNAQLSRLQGIELTFVK
jgi:hypothetical protein